MKLYNYKKISRKRGQAHAPSFILPALKKNYGYFSELFSRKNYKKSNLVRGQAVMVAVIFFMLIALVIVLGVTTPVIRQIRIVVGLHLSRQSYFAAEAGSEDAYYRIKNNLTTSFPETLVLGTATTTVTLATTGINEEEITASGNASNYIRTVVKDITVTDGFSFNFGVQTGVGGLYMNNGSLVLGNVYSNGIIQGGSSNPNSYNFIEGSAVSAGPSGFISDVHASSSLYAHSIDHTTIGGSAYYASTFTNSTISGTTHPGSADQPLIDFPIPDSLISQWESDAAAGGTATCTNGSYTITSNVTIGPKKIPCDLTISGNGTTVIVAGAVWVTGNITISGTGGTGVQMKVADPVGDKSVPVIADNPSAQTTSSKIVATGNSNFYGSTGNADSYVMLISMNKSAEQGGSVLAMDFVNGAAGNLLTYASHGQIKLENNVALREVTAYKLTLINNTEVIYSIGLAQTLFTSGPGGTWKIKKWREI
ncbi:MAG: hypothetical protein PHS53_04080 [Candidatus Pacebacteria bacterium]|nr:hypothetical protein [Candidatus Paceibacterota bacterium]